MNLQVQGENIRDKERDDERVKCLYVVLRCQPMLSGLNFGMMQSFSLSSLNFSADNNVVPLHKRQPF